MFFKKKTKQVFIEKYRFWGFKIRFVIPQVGRSNVVGFLFTGRGPRWVKTSELNDSY